MRKPWLCVDGFQYKQVTKLLSASYIHINRQWSSPLDSSAQTILEQKGGEKALKMIFIQDIKKKTSDLENRGHFTMAVKNYKQHSTVNYCIIQIIWADWYVTD